MATASLLDKSLLTEILFHGLRKADFYLCQLWRGCQTDSRFINSLANIVITPNNRLMDLMKKSIRNCRQ
jgi:hypothetical protein